MTAVAIDFGTSNTVISILESDTKSPKSLRFTNQSRLFVGVNSKGERLEVPVVPSLLFIKEGNQVVLGENIRNQRLGLSQAYPPESLFKKFKRDLACDYQPPSRHLDGNSYSSTSVSELFIQTLWKQIKQQNIQPSHVIFVADHRQDLPIDELVEVWNEIDNTTVDIFINSAIDIYRSMVSLNSNILPFVSSPDIKNFNLQKQLVDILNAPNCQTIKISADNLAMTQQNIISILQIDEMQERCSQIVSIFNSFNFSNSLYNVLKLGQDTQRLAKVMLIIDVFNFIDNLYPYNLSAPQQKINSLLDICQQEGLSGYEILDTAYSQRDTMAEQKFREVRNKIADHVDSNLNLNNSLALLDSTDIDELINKIWTPAYKAFEEWCHLDIIRCTYLIDKNPEVHRVSEVEDSGGYKPYY